MAVLKEKAGRLKRFLLNQPCNSFTTPEGILFSLTVQNIGIFVRIPENEDDPDYSYYMATKDLDAVREFLGDHGYTFSVRENGEPNVSRKVTCVAS